MITLSVAVLFFAGLPNLVVQTREREKCLLQRILVAPASPLDRRECARNQKVDASFPARSAALCRFGVLISVMRLTLEHPAQKCVRFCAETML
jgi:hypothetical protein